MKPQALSYAKFRHRALAQILDVFLLFAITAPFLYLLNALFLPLMHSTAILIAYRVFRFALLLAIVLSSFSWCLSRFGATPGKLLLGLKVINIQTGKYLNPQQAMLRILLSILSMCSVIGVLLAVFNKARQTAHDKVLHTVVVQQDDDYAREPLPANWERP